MPYFSARSLPRAGINQPAHVDLCLLQIFSATFLLVPPDVFDYVPLEKAFKAFFAEHGLNGIDALDAVIGLVVIGVGGGGHAAI